MRNWVEQWLVKAGLKSQGQGSPTKSGHGIKAARARQKGGELGTDGLASRIVEVDWPVNKQVELCLFGEAAEAAVIVKQPWCSEEAKLGFARTAPAKLVNQWIGEMSEGHTESKAVCETLLKRDLGLTLAAKSAATELRGPIWQQIIAGKASEIDIWTAARAIWVRNQEAELVQEWYDWAAQYARKIRSYGRAKEVQEDFKIRSKIKDSLVMLNLNKGSTEENLLAVAQEWGGIIYELKIEVAKNARLSAEARARFWPELVQTWRGLGEAEGTTWHRREINDYHDGVLNILKNAIEQQDPGVELMVRDVFEDEVLLSAMERVCWFAGKEQTVNPKWLAPFIADTDKKVREKAILIAGKVGAARKEAEISQPGSKEPSISKPIRGVAR